MLSLKKRLGVKGAVGARLILMDDIPKTIEEAVNKYPYLAEYLNSLSNKPRYMVNLSLELKVGEETSVLYPLGKGIFIHVFKKGTEGKYVIIEPPKPPAEILRAVETAVGRLVDEKIVGESPFEELINLYNMAKRKKIFKAKNLNEEYLLYHFLREKVGYGFLEGLLADPYLEDISVPGAGNIFVYHRIFGSLETNVNIPGEEIDRVLRSIAERFGKILSYSNPIIDIHLPDGSRFNIVFGEDISLKGSNFTIRKFAKEPVSIAHLIRWRTISAEAAAYLWMLFDVGISALICGETASGKTTTLNALTAFIKHDAKIVSIEETPEVNLFHKNWVREITRLHTGSPVTMFDLLKAALRQRPDYIIVGEIRGEEGKIAFQAIETGHPVISTMHAGSMEQLLQRLTSHPIDVPKTHISSLNLAVFQARIERDGRLIRRILSINEILGYDPNEDRIVFLPSVIYDPDADSHDFMKMSYLLENTVLRFRGWGRDRIQDLYEELEMRKEILKYLSEKRPSYVDVFKTVIEVNNKGVKSVYEAIKEGKTPWLD
ncbi:MAG: type II/IV secretion system ATPase subunit [Candidatus Bathyarchaeia archaeon]